MKILLVAPQSKDTVLGVIGNYCRNALTNLGYDTEVFDFRESQYLKNPFGLFIKKTIKKFYQFPREQLQFAKSLQNEKMNKALLEKIKQFCPEIMLVLMGDDISVETLEEIKKLGVIRANWFTDTVLDPRRGRVPFVANISRYYDYFFVYDSPEVLKFAQIDSKHVESIPLACEPSVHKSILLTDKEKKRYASQVCFVGTVDSMREDLLKSLTEFDLGLWGNWQRKDPQLNKFYREKHVYFQEATKIYNASDITLDIHIFFGTNNKAFDINPRVFEAAGCGAFVLTNENEFLSELFEIDEEIVCYKDKEELKDKIKYYLAKPDERILIGKKAQQRAYQDHTYEKRIQKMISIILQRG